MEQENNWQPMPGRRARLRGSKKSVLITSARYNTGEVLYTLRRPDGSQMEAYANELLPPEITAS